MRPGRIPLCASLILSNVFSSSLVYESFSHVLNLFARASVTSFCLLGHFLPILSGPKCSSFQSYPWKPLKAFYLYITYNTNDVGN